MDKPRWQISYEKDTREGVAAYLKTYGGKDLMEFRFKTLELIAARDKQISALVLFDELTKEGEKQFAKAGMSWKDWSIPDSKAGRVADILQKPFKGVSDNLPIEYHAVISALKQGKHGRLVRKIVKLAAIIGKSVRSSGRD